LAGDNAEDETHLKHTDEYEILLQADEREFQEALNFADRNFDEQSDDESPNTILEHKESSENDDPFDNQKREILHHKQQFKQLQTEIKERWKILEAFTDRKTAEK